MIRLSSAFFLFLIFIISACEEEAAVDSQDPNVVISSPQEGATISSGAEVPVKVDITDDFALATVRVNVLPPEGESQTILNQTAEDFTDDNRTATIDQSFPLGVGVFPAGEYIFTVVAEDETGNVTEETVTVELMEEAEASVPTITINSPEEGAVFLPEEEITFEASVTDEVALAEFSLWVSPPAGEAQLLHAAGDEAFTNEGKEARILETISFPSDAAIGNYTLTVKALNESGTEAEKSVTISISEPDEVAPTISVNEPLGGAEFYSGGVVPVDALVEDNARLASVTVSALFPDGHSQLLYTKPAAEFYSEAKAAKLDVSLYLGKEPVAGDYSIIFKASDVQENVTEESVTIKIKEADVSAPTVSISSPEEETIFSAEDPISLQASVQDNEGLEEVTVWVAPPGGQAQLVHTESPEDFLAEGKEAAIQETISLGSDDPESGSYRLIVKARDQLGNVTEKSTTIVIDGADTSAPVITLHSPEAGATYAVGDVVTLDLLVEDNEMLAEIALVVLYENQTPVYENSVEEFDEDKRHQEQDSMPLTSEAQAGTYYVTITATDAAGNEAEETYTFEVVN